MAHRRMLIEDFDLMIEARRCYLAELERDKLLGEVQARDLRVLEEDKRLESAIFMEWELRDEADEALQRALTLLFERVPDQASEKGVPEEHRAAYIEGKREAVLRCRARLAGELGN